MPTVLEPAHFNWIFKLFISQIKYKLNYVGINIHRFGFEECLKKYLVRMIDRVHIFTLAGKAYPSLSILHLISNTKMESFFTS